MEQKYELLKQAYNNAYAKYSNFQVGALIVLKNGKFVMGSNIENASYGLTNCAERSALFSAYSQGYRKDDILELLIMTRTEEPSSPCGACRQVISELMNPDASVILVNLKMKKVVMKVVDLLPNCFNEDKLND